MELASESSTTIAGVASSGNIRHHHRVTPLLKRTPPSPPPSSILQVSPNSTSDIISVDLISAPAGLSTAAGRSDHLLDKSHHYNVVANSLPNSSPSSSLHSSNSSLNLSNPNLLITNPTSGHHKSTFESSRSGGGPSPSPLLLLPTHSYHAYHYHPYLSPSGSHSFSYQQVAQQLTRSATTSLLDVGLKTTRSKLHASNSSISSLSSNSSSSSISDLVASTSISVNSETKKIAVINNTVTTASTTISNMSGVTVANHPHSPLSAAATATTSSITGSGDSTATVSAIRSSGNESNPSQLLAEATLSPDSPPVMPLDTAGSLAPNIAAGSTAAIMSNSTATMQQFRQQILELKQQQQLQQQLLLQHYQQQQAQLNEHHEKQIQEHIREYIEQQKKLEVEVQQQQEQREREDREARERAEKDRIQKEKAQSCTTITGNNHEMWVNNSITNSGNNSGLSNSSSSSLSKKKKENPSAVASMEVKQRLQEFVLAKKQQREAAAAAAAAAAANSGATTTSTAPGAGTPSPPSTISSRIVPWHNTLGKYDNDFPLRKTASEPNLKVRSALKAKVIQRRSSPLLRRKDKPSPLKRRTMSNDMANGIPENSCSPPSGTLSHQSSFQSSSGSTPIQEEPSQSPFNGMNQMVDLQLYSSPSLPNISIGKPHHPLGVATGPHTHKPSVIQFTNNSDLNKTLASGQLNEMQMRAFRLSMASGGSQAAAAATASGHTPFFPSLPVIEGEFTPPTSPSYLQQQLQILEDRKAAAAAAAQVVAAHQSQSSNPNIFAAAAQAVSQNSAANFSAAALYSYATAAAAVGIPVSDQMATAAAVAANNLYNRSLQQHQQQAAINPNSITTGHVGAMRPTAALHAARLVQRPLGRTQSAPLPLGHPALLQQNGSKSPNSSATTSASNLVKQQIRNAVLTRASSKGQMVENVEEETEAAVAAEMDDQPISDGSNRSSNKICVDISDQVIDLTAKPRHGSIGSNPETTSSATFPTVDLMNPSTLIHNAHRIDPTAVTGSTSNIHQMSPNIFFLTPGAGQSASSSAFSLEGSTLAAALYQRSLLAAAVASGNSNSMFGGSTSGTGAVSFRSPLLHHHHLVSNTHPSRPLSRTLSSPQVMLSHTSSNTSSPPNSSGTRSPDISTNFAANGSGSNVCYRFTTALVYDSFMQKHQCNCADTFQHVEHGGRLQSIWARLTETGLAARCERVRSRKATLEEIQTCHSEAYTLLFGSSPQNRHKIDPAKLAELPIKGFVMLPCGGIGVDSDTTWNDANTSAAARMAAGCVIELATRVALKEIKNGFAVVRPPGSHAEHSQPMGFCFFNSLAIAAKHLQQKLNVKRILIVDWDVHHGNGLQQMFFNDPGVLYISLHRHDEGNFFPGTGDLSEIGIGAGTGFNVNIGWKGTLNPPMSDAEYLAAFRSIVMPIARQYEPEIVLVACGFDGARGHPPPLGGYLISPACFGFMTQQLLSLAEGRVVMALEGGYELTSICDSAQACVSALLGDQIPPVSKEEIARKPASIAIDLLNQVISTQVPHWSILRRYAHLIGCDASEAARKERDECETVTAMASLTMKHVKSPESQIIDEPMDQDNVEK